MTDPPRFRLFTRIWRFQPAPGAEREFVEVYGPSGAWARLFGLGNGYIGTELRPLEDGSGAYLTTDRWQSRGAWERFLREHAEAYHALDRASEALTTSESLVAEFSDEDS